VSNAPRSLRRDYDRAHCMPILSIDVGLQRLAPVADGVDLWRIDLDALAPLVDGALLSDEERHRAERLRFERDRGRYLAAHFALRVLLGRALAHAPETLVFTQAEFGKPQLAGMPRCAFNLSHSEGVALVALGGERALGVDIEVIRELSDVHALAQRCCTPAECAQLFAQPAHALSRFFLRIWTRKEACLKAMGVGLSAGLQSVEVDANDLAADGDDGQLIEVAVPARRERLQLHTLALGQEQVGALAISAAPGTLAR
jgi:4'-phosphopantetheinyl transferase